MNIEQARFNMIEQQIRPWDVLDQDILDLLFIVKRENFVPPAYKNIAFSDVEIPLANGEHMFTPKLEARILQEVAIRKHENVLEIGTGSGYMAALLASHARHVLSVEIDPALKALADNNLHNNGITNVETVLGNGAQGFVGQGKTTAPYDVIVISGSLPILPSAFLEQLKVGGRLFAIVGQAPAMTAKIITRVSAITFHTLGLFETDTAPLRQVDTPSHFTF